MNDHLSSPFAARLLRPRALAAACVWAALAGAVAAQAPAGEGDVLAVIGATELRDADIDALLRLRPGAFGDKTEAARARALETLKAEHLDAERYASGLSAFQTVIAEALEDARRRVNFDIFARSQFRTPTPSDNKVDAFVAENPDLFADRMTYRIQRFSLMDARGRRARGHRHSHRRAGDRRGDAREARYGDP
jgi:hypothetical protein